MSWDFRDLSRILEVLVGFSEIFKCYTSCEEAIIALTTVQPLLKSQKHS